MKKFLLLLVCVFSLLGLTACEQLKVVGKWQLSEMTMNYLGVEVTIKAGESFMGMEISKDYVEFEFNSDKTGTVKYAEDNEIFNWEYKDEKFVLTDPEDSDSDPMILYMDGDYLIWEEEGTTIKFLKAE